MQPRAALCLSDSLGKLKDSNPPEMAVSCAMLQTTECLSFWSCSSAKQPWPEAGFLLHLPIFQFFFHFSLAH